MRTNFRNLAYLFGALTLVTGRLTTRLSAEKKVTPICGLNRGLKLRPGEPSEMLIGEPLE